MVPSLVSVLNADSDNSTDGMPREYLVHHRTKEHKLKMPILFITLYVVTWQTSGVTMRILSS